MTIDARCVASLRALMHSGKYPFVMVCLFGCLIAGLSPASSAAPSSCKPNAGATRECTSILKTPWTYKNITCQTTVSRASESEALDYEIALDYGGSTHCNLQWTRFGWLTSQATVGYCGNPSPEPQTFYGGNEVSNASKYTFTWETCSNHQPQQLTAFYVQRTRSLVCPTGYSSGGNGYCFIESTQVDRVKNLGKPCPSCGNPINPALGNKFQEEVDYQGSGSFPLRFVRYYNSAMRMADNDNGHYGVGAYAATFGNAAVAGLAAADSETGYAAVGLDLIGANWRHSYQAAIVAVSTTAIVSAHVYRPDGRVLVFNVNGSGYVAPTDVSERLERLPDNSWRLTTPDDNVETYSDVGRLLSIRNRAGLTQTLSYDGCGRLTSVSDDFGHALTFNYAAGCGAFNVQNRITSITDPSGGAYQYAYGLEGTLDSVTYPDTTTRQYQYSNPSFKRALTGLLDESGLQYASWTYDASGRANSSQHAGGADAVTVVYTNSCANCAWYWLSKAVATDALGAVRTYNLAQKSGMNKVTSIVQPAASGTGTATLSYTYDANNNITRRRDFRGLLTCYTFDLTRNLETQRVEGLTGTNCPGTTVPGVTRTIATTWHPTLRLPDVITEPGRRTDYDYDSTGNVLTKTITDTSVTPNVSRVWTYTYDSYGRVLTEDGPRTDVSDVTTYTYYTCATGNECGQVHTVTNALGQVTTFNTYNAHGRPLTVTDPDNVVTTLTYDLRQRLTSRIVSSETTALEYWPTGLLKKVTQPDSSFVLYTYDAAHRLIKIEDGDGNRVEYTLDAMGNRTAENAYDPSSALSRTRTQVFNTLGRLWKLIGAAGTPAVTTTFGYDDNGNQTSVAAPLSRNTANQYDELNRLKQINDPAAGITKFAYNGVDDLTSVTDPRNKVTSYSYSGFSDLAQQVSPDSGTTANTYDSGGNLATTTDARSKSGTYSYDALNRVTSIAYPDLTTTLTYDAGTNGVGRLTGASDANHSLSWTYDAQGRVTGKSQTVGAITKSVSYGYTNGNLTSLTTPSGQTITYSYSNGRISSMTLNGSTTVLNGVLYEPFGPVSGWTWGNSTLAARVYDTDGKPTSLDSAGAYSYGYDDAFRITSISDLADSSKSWTYGYDALDRLNAASKTGQTIGYTYDANGNRLTQTGTQSATYTISTTNNRITSIAGTPTRTYSYDASGNTTGDGTLTFAYQDNGRMSSVTSGGVTTSYVLNALGQRVKKSNSSLTRLFMYDEGGHLLGEYDGTGALVQETVWMGDIPVATLRPNGGSVTLYYVHTDHLNAPRRVSRPSDNAVLWRWDSDPFGMAAANEDPDGDSTLLEYSLRFPGQYIDAESGLNYNYARHYDPALGRYAQSDPIGMRGGVNTYAYALGNPVNYFDEFGLDVLVCRQPAFGWMPIDHKWIKTDTAEAGMGGTRGNEPGNQTGDRPGDPVQVTDHTGRSKQENASCEKVADVDEKKVNELLKIGRPLGNWGPFNQCQTFVRDVLTQSSTKPPPPPPPDPTWWNTIPIF